MFQQTKEQHCCLLMQEFKRNTIHSENNRSKKKKMNFGQYYLYETLMEIGFMAKKLELSTHLGITNETKTHLIVFFAANLSLQ